MESNRGCVVALAGRRIDPPDARTARFPLANVPVVRERLAALFAEIQPRALVCSAACGADLLALEVGRTLGLRCRIVLPFDPQRFRASSVTDRPGNWGPVFDRMIAAVAAAGDLVVLDTADDGEQSYAEANEAILSEAQALAEGRDLARSRAPGSRPRAVLAVLAWDGHSRGDDDLTAIFAAAARRRGITLREVATASA